MFYFLPVFFFGYFITRFQNAFLLAASLLFYAWGEVEYVFLIVLSSLANYLLGKFMVNYPSKKKAILIAGIAGNLASICAFKYLSFFCNTLNALLSFAGLPNIPEYSAHLPLGISFFTFQAMSYIIDIYRKDAPAESNPFNVMLYISMFPQLIAGPIVRFQTICDEIHNRVTTAKMFVKGIRCFAIGLGQKVLIANTVAMTTDQIFALPLEELNFLLTWLGAVTYTLQIYYDFGGYSNMAIGLGLMLGFHFPENFNHPYSSQSLTEFWRRWHITLSRWFKDYLYIPLGGNKKGAFRTYLNLFVVFSLCGLWHGASWTFVVWGIYHGFFLIFERMGLLRVLGKLPRLARHMYTLLIIIFGWVLFRAETFPQAWGMITTMVGAGSSGEGIYRLGYYLPTDVIFAILAGSVFALPVREFLQSQWFHKLDHPEEKTVQGILFFLSIAFQTILLGLSIMHLASGAYNPFIYFRF